MIDAHHSFFSNYPLQSIIQSARNFKSLSHAVFVKFHFDPCHRFNRHLKMKKQNSAFFTALFKNMKKKLTQRMTLFTTCRIPFYSTNTNSGVLLLCFRLTDYALVMIARVMGRVYLQRRQKQLLLNKIAPFSLATAGWLKEEETVKWRERFSQDNQDHHAQVSVMGILEVIYQT